MRRIPSSASRPAIATWDFLEMSARPDWLAMSAYEDAGQPARQSPLVVVGDIRQGLAWLRTNGLRRHMGALARAAAAIRSARRVPWSRPALGRRGHARVEPEQ
jgi:hypothetical protein